MSAIPVVWVLDFGQRTAEGDIYLGTSPPVEQGLVELTDSLRSCDALLVPLNDGAGAPAWAGRQQTQLVVLTPEEREAVVTALLAERAPHRFVQVSLDTRYLNSSLSLAQQPLECDECQEDALHPLHQVSRKAREEK